MHPTLEDVKRASEFLSYSEKLELIRSVTESEPELSPLKTIIALLESAEIVAPQN